MEKRPNRKSNAVMHGKIPVPEPLTTVHPGTDFYKHINGHWISSTRMPAVNTSYGVSEEVEKVIDERLLLIMERCKKRAEAGRPTKTRQEDLEDAIGRLAMSSLREEKQKYSVEYLKRGIMSIGCIRDTNDIGHGLGKMCRFQIPTILNVVIAPELKKGIPTYTFSLAPGSLGLPSPQYYAATPGKMDVLFAYTKFCKQITSALEIDDLSSVIPIEGQISPFLIKSENDTAVYYKDVKALMADFKAIPWAAFFSGYGVTMEELKEIRVDSKPFLSYVNTLMTKLPLGQWYLLLSLHTLLHALPLLPPPFDTLHFEFFEKRLKGQKAKISQKELTLQILKTRFSYAIDYFFVEEELTMEFKKQSTRFVEHILKSASLRVKDIPWLSAAAAKRASEKLLAARLSVGWSQEVQSHPRAPPLLQTDNLLANIYLIESAETEEVLRRYTRSDGHVNLTALWDEPSFTVNAYYYHETNQVLIPAGSFAWPFYEMDYESNLGWNYGGLGAIIGHEITHAFDEEGKNFNEKGEEEPWWSATDLRHYKEKTKELVRIFDQAKILGRPVNGTATLSENLADLGGLGIALDALKRELAGKAEAYKKKQLQQFFASYAISWRTKERPERTLQRLFMDKHAPVELRVNLIVSQFDEWYEAFDVRTADTLYVPPEERIRIF